LVQVVLPELSLRAVVGVAEIPLSQQLPHLAVLVVADLHHQLVLLQAWQLHLLQLMVEREPHLPVTD
jgi:hypothetical protein